MAKNNWLKMKRLQLLVKGKSISITFSPIGRNIELSKTHRFSERKQDHEFQYHGQHDSLYYQLQPPTYN